MNTCFRFSLVAFCVLLLAACKPDFKELVEEANTYNLTTEKQLIDSIYAQEINTFYEAGTEGFFQGKDSIAIYFKIFEHKSSDKAIVISSGRTEAAIKYKELIFDLHKNGYAIYIHDHRGQGQSGRMTTDPEMGYIDDFQFYIDDMKQFFNTYVAPKNYQKTYLLAHSMGGAIGMTYLQQYPTDFNAAAFSSPMLGLTPGICGVTNVIVREEPKYAIGESEYKDSKADFKENTLTNSKVRFDRMIDAFDEVPEARLGGATYQWVHKSCEQFTYLFSHIEAIETPFILFSAAQEQIVHPFDHQRFITAAQNLGKSCKAYEVADAQHELLIEKDIPRIETINTTLDFYASY